LRGYPCLGCAGRGRSGSKEEDKGLDTARRDRYQIERQANKRIKQSELSVDECSSFSPARYIFLETRKNATFTVMPRLLAQMDNEFLDNLTGLLIVLAMTAFWSGSMDLFLVFVVQLVGYMGFLYWSA
jgi:hypothetical protein